MPIELKQRLRPAAGEPHGALVLIHGRGANEHDLADLVDAFDPEQRLLGVLPRGPLSLPPGGAHWYVVPRVGFPDPATFAESYAALGALLDGLPAAYGVPADRIVVGGFSQGAVMSLALGLGTTRPAPAAVVAMSGFVPAVDGFTPDLEGRPDLPVFVSHGTYDPVISVDYAHAARDLLAGHVALTYRETPVPHTVDPALVPEIGAFVAAATGG
jgi:phospholipase/carboxylesterase